MEVKFFFFIGIALLLIGYYIYVLYYTLQRKRKFDKSADARELYVRSKAFHLLLFGDLFRSDKSNSYKILNEDQPNEDNATVDNPKL